MLSAHDAPHDDAAEPRKRTRRQEPTPKAPETPAEREARVLARQRARNAALYAASAARNAAVVEQPAMEFLVALQKEPASYLAMLPRDMVRAMLAPLLGAPLGVGCMPDFAGRRQLHELDALHFDMSLGTGFGAATLHIEPLADGCCYHLLTSNGRIFCVDPKKPEIRTTVTLVPQTCPEHAAWRTTSHTYEIIWSAHLERRGVSYDRWYAVYNRTSGRLLASRMWSGDKVPTDATGVGTAKTHRPVLGRDARGLLASIEFNLPPGAEVHIHMPQLRRFDAAHHDARVAEAALDPDNVVALQCSAGTLGPWLALPPAHPWCTKKIDGMRVTDCRFVAMLMDVTDTVWLFAYARTCSTARIDADQRIYHRIVASRHSVVDGRLLSMQTLPGDYDPQPTCFLFDRVGRLYGLTDGGHLTMYSADLTAVEDRVHLTGIGGPRPTMTIDPSGRLLVLQQPPKMLAIKIFA
jgi:hypothetical protein